MFLFSTFLNSNMPIVNSVAFKIKNNIMVITLISKIEYPFYNDEVISLV